MIIEVRYRDFVLHSKLDILRLTIYKRHFVSNLLVSRRSRPLRARTILSNRPHSPTKSATPTAPYASPTTKPSNPPTTIQMRPPFHRRRTSPSSPIKPPSVLRYTLILLKARPTNSDIDTLSYYAETRSAPNTPTRKEIAGTRYFPASDEKQERKRREESPPPPYTP